MNSGGRFGNPHCPRSVFRAVEAEHGATQARGSPAWTLSGPGEATSASRALGLGGGLSRRGSSSITGGTSRPYRLAAEPYGKPPKPNLTVEELGTAATQNVDVPQAQELVGGEPPRGERAWFQGLIAHALHATGDRGGGSLTPQALGDRWGARRGARSARILDSSAQPRNGFSAAPRSAPRYAPNLGRTI
jgi:hypothetical protein